MHDGDVCAFQLVRRELQPLCVRMLVYILVANELWKRWWFDRISFYSSSSRRASASDMNILQSHWTRDWTVRSRASFGLTSGFHVSMVGRTKGWILCRPKEVCPVCCNSIHSNQRRLKRHLSVLQEYSNPSLRQKKFLIIRSGCYTTQGGLS